MLLPLRVEHAMFSTRDRTARPLLQSPEPTEQVLALIRRVRVLSLNDTVLADLLLELEPYLPKPTIRAS